MYDSHYCDSGGVLSRFALAYSLVVMTVHRSALKCLLVNLLHVSLERSLNFYFYLIFCIIRIGSQLCPPLPLVIILIACSLYK